MSELSQDEAIDRIWELTRSIGICMFVTWDGERQRSRPVAARPDRDAHAIHFLTDESGAKDDQVRAFPTVNLSFADQRNHKYVSITGQAKVTDDREKIRELFSPFDKAWWDSPDDPGIRLITVHPADAELWDGNGRLRSGVAMLAAAVTGAKPAVGTNRKVDRL